MIMTGAFGCLLVAACQACVPIIVGAAAGSAAGERRTRELLIASGQIADQGATAVGIVLDENMVITELIPGRSAEQAGVEVGDKIIKVAGRVVSIRQEAYNRLFGRPGKKVSIVVLRDGEALYFKLRRWREPIKQEQAEGIPF